MCYCAILCDKLADGNFASICIVILNRNLHQARRSTAFLESCCTMSSKLQIGVAIPSMIRGTSATTVPFETQRTSGKTMVKLLA